MWAVADLLLAFVVLATLVGFHVGPHSHAAAGVVGVLAAGWLLLMAASGHADPLLWAAVAADGVVTAGVGTAAVRGFKAERLAEQLRPPARMTGAEGQAMSDLDPDGIVHVRGESWSATSLNGKILKGAKVHVVEAEGVRLGVWGEDTAELEGAPSFTLEADEPGAETGGGPDEQRTDQ